MDGSQGSDSLPAATLGTTARRCACIDAVYPRSPRAGSWDLRTARTCFYCYAVQFVWVSNPEDQAADASMPISEAALARHWQARSHVVCADSPIATAAIYLKINHCRR